MKYFYILCKRPYVILEGLGLWKAMGNTDFCPLILGQQVCFRVSTLLRIHNCVTPKSGK